MNTWIILLRGINVGGNNKLPMKELRDLMEQNGFKNVKTYIQSGNVVCSFPDRPNQELGSLIESQFGFNPSIFILSADELREAASHNPFPTDIGKAVHFYFFHQKPKSIDEELLNSLKSKNESFELIGQVFYLHAPDGIGRSKLAEKIPKAFSKADMTARNLNTINKLLEMLN